MSDESTNTTASTASSVASLQPRRVSVNSVNDVRPVLQTTLNQLDYAFIKKAEQMSGLDRVKVSTPKSTLKI